MILGVWGQVFLTLFACRTLQQRHFFIYSKAKVPSQNFETSLNPQIYLEEHTNKSPQLPSSARDSTNRNTPTPRLAGLSWASPLGAAAIGGCCST